MNNKRPHTVSKGIMALPPNLDGVEILAGRAEAYRHVTIPWRWGMLKKMRETNRGRNGSSEPRIGYPETGCVVERRR